MQEFTVTFNSVVKTAKRKITARTPKAALQRGRRIAPSVLTSPHPVDEIKVERGGKELYCWQSNGYRLRLWTPDLLAAACNVIEKWETADLAEAVGELTAVVQAIRSP